jgi:hypothetical protein
MPGMSIGPPPWCLTSSDRQCLDPTSRGAISRPALASPFFGFWAKLSMEEQWMHSQFGETYAKYVHRTTAARQSDGSMGQVLRRWSFSSKYSFQLSGNASTVSACCTNRTSSRP